MMRILWVMMAEWALPSGRIKMAFWLDAVKDRVLFESTVEAARLRGAVWKVVQGRTNGCSMADVREPDLRVWLTGSDEGQR